MKLDYTIVKFLNKIYFKIFAVSKKFFFCQKIRTILFGSYPQPTRFEFILHQTKGKPYHIESNQNQQNQ